MRCWGTRRCFLLSFSLLPLFDFLCPFLGALIFNFSGKASGGQRGSTTSRSRTVDRIWFCKFSRHDLHRSHAMYEEINKKNPTPLHSFFE